MSVSVDVFALISRIGCARGAMPPFMRGTAAETRAWLKFMRNGLVVKARFPCPVRNERTSATGRTDARRQANLLGTSGRRVAEPCATPGPARLSLPAWPPNSLLAAGCARLLPSRPPLGSGFRIALCAATPWVSACAALDSWVCPSGGGAVRLRILLKRLLLARVSRPQSFVLARHLWQNAVRHSWAGSGLWRSTVPLGLLALQSSSFIVVSPGVISSFLTQGFHRFMHHVRPPAGISVWPAVVPYQWRHLQFGLEAADASFRRLCALQPDCAATDSKKSAPHPVCDGMILAPVCLSLRQSKLSASTLLPVELHAPVRGYVAQCRATPAERRNLRFANCAR